MLRGLAQRFDLPALRRLLAGSGMLLGGNVLASLIGLISLALTARHLGTREYGLLVLISTGVATLDKVVNFQSWQALIKYGVEPWNGERLPALRGLMRLGFLLDFSTALVAAGLANVAIQVGAELLGWSSEIVALATLYTVTIAFNWSGMPIAMLRLAGQYRRLALHAGVAAAFKLLLVGFAVWYGRDLKGFVIAWLISDIFGYLLLTTLGLLEMRRRGLFHVQADGVTATRLANPGIVRFLFIANMHSAVRLGTTEADTMLVGALLGSAAAGMFNIVKKFAKLVSIVLTPLYQVVYPELARARAQGDSRSFTALVDKSTIIMGGFCLAGWLLFLAAGRELLSATVGNEYLVAYWPLLVYLVGVSLSVMSFAYQPAMLALGRVGTAFKILLWATAIYLMALVALGTWLGLIGVCAAYVVFYLVWVSWMRRHVSRGIADWKPVRALEM